jgi:REP element-mobilizing transposase RayT
MRPYEDIDIHARNLPHWSQDNVLVFATWRLADSLPHAKLQEIEEKQKAFLSRHPEPWDEEILRLYRKYVSRDMEDFLDSGCGSCVLKDANIRKEVEDALHFFDGKRYRLHAFVVMPNHVHVLFALLSGYPQTKVLHSWKSFTATVINKALGRQGQLWQDESWDRLIRNENHYRNCLEYIQNNNSHLAHVFVNSTGSTGTGSTGILPVDTGSTGILPVHSTNRQDACSPSGGAHSTNRQDACSPSGGAHSTNRQDACSPSGGAHSTNRQDACSPSGESSQKTKLSSRKGSDNRRIIQTV